jgi:Uncharacterized proteins, LmbE homologs
MKKIIYLSPHLDDAVLSCGAILWEQVRQHKPVEVWTIFAGDPPSQTISPLAQEIHERWRTGAQAPTLRRAEDQLACERLNVTPVHLSFPDCIYRTRPGTDQPLIEKNEELFGPLPESQEALLQQLTAHLKKTLPQDSILVLPLVIGNHIDHQLTRKAGELLAPDCYYYADFPYAGDHPEELEARLPENSAVYHFPISNQALSTWQYAAEAYTSQISTFWPSLSGMYTAIDAYAKSAIGNCLWQSHSAN